MCETLKQEKVNKSTLGFFSQMYEKMSDLLAH